MHEIAPSQIYPFTRLYGLAQAIITTISRLLMLTTEDKNGVKKRKKMQVLAQKSEKLQIFGNVFQYFGYHYPSIRKKHRELAKGAR
jgi:hypothetical protein